MAPAAAAAAALLGSTHAGHHSGDDSGRAPAAFASCATAVTLRFLHRPEWLQVSDSDQHAPFPRFSVRAWYAALRLLPLLPTSLPSCIIWNQGQLDLSLACDVA